MTTFNNSAIEAKMFLEDKGHTVVYTAPAKNGHTPHDDLPCWLVNNEEPPLSKRQLIEFARLLLPEGSAGLEPEPPEQLLPVGAPTPDSNEIPIALIDPNPQQPRQHFDPDALQELADSIKTHGVIQPVVVEPNNGRYTLIAGERRLRASQLAGLLNIPATIRQRPTDTKTRLIQATVENVQRADMNDMEKAAAYAKLHDDHGMSDTEIAVTMGLGEKGRTTVANSRRLMKLPPDMQAAIIAGIISQRTALAYMPLLDLKAHQIGEADLNKQPTFSTYEAPTPAALRKRLCDPEKYGGKLTSEDVRRLAEKIIDRCTPLPCSQCGTNAKYIKHVIDTNGNIWCKKCEDNRQRGILETRYCSKCGHGQEISLYNLVNPVPLGCGGCGLTIWTNTALVDTRWLKEPKKEPEYRPLMETCPDCKDVAFFPQGGWICDRCKKKCSKLEAQYNHGPDVICKKCHIASHPIQTVTLDTITARLDIILDKYAAYPCHLCDQKKIIINSQLDTVKCEHCGNQWDTIDEYHAERTGPKLSDVVQNKPKAIPYVWCINCGESTPGGGRHSEKTNRNLCQRCYDKENAPAPNMQQIRESLWERLQKILANITPENALEFDAWLDDVEKEFLQAAT